MLKCELHGLVRAAQSRNYLAFFLLYSNSPNFSELIQDFLFKKNASLAILVGSNDVLKHVISGV